MLEGVSRDADKCRVMPDGSFTQVLDKPEAAALAANGSVSMRACRA